MHTNKKKAKIPKDRLLKNALDGSLANVRRMLGKGIPVDTRAQNGCTSLMVASEKGHVAIVKALLQFNANVNAVNKKGGSSLYFAAQELHPDVLEVLIEAGADVFSEDDAGHTALHGAMFDKTNSDSAAEIARVLIRFGARVDAHSKISSTPLYIAAQSGQLKGATVLLEAGASVNKTVEDGATPLHITCRFQHPEMVALLLSAGADVNALAKDWTTPLMSICSRGTDPVKVVQIVRQLLQAKADANYKTPEGVTALMHAADRNQNDAIRCLVIEGGAQLSLRDQNGRRAFNFTPLGSTTCALIEQLERDGADEIVLTKYAGPRRSGGGETAAAGPSAVKVDDEKLCWTCQARQGGSLCSGCREARYCSVDCQRAGWQAGHKEVCRWMKAATEEME